MGYDAVRKHAQVARHQYRHHEQLRCAMPVLRHNPLAHVVMNLTSCTFPHHN